MNIIYLAASFACIFLLFYVYHKLSNPDEITKDDSIKKSIKKYILTIRVNLDSPVSELRNTIDSIINYNIGISAFIDMYVISSIDWSEEIKQKYSFVNFVQMPIKGEAESLNLILNLIKPYTYWIQWEEFWQCNRTFLFEAIKIMDETKTTQLEFIKNIEEPVDLKLCHLMPNNNTYCFINDLDKLLFTLNPSINRVKDIINSDKEFSERWIKNKYIKASFLETSVVKK